MSSTKNLFGTIAFTCDEQKRTDAYLRQKLRADMLSRRPGPGGRRLTYLESNKAIEIANEAFGFNGWSCRIVDCNLEYVHYMHKEKGNDGRWSLGYSAVVQIQLKDGTTHEDVGFGQSEGLKDLGAAIDISKKASISDARKRALRLFGNYLGNSCYDKEHIKDVAANRTNSTPLQSPTSIKLENGAASEPPLQITNGPSTSTAAAPNSASSPAPNSSATSSSVPAKSTSAAPYTIAAAVPPTHPPRVVRKPIQSSPLTSGIAQVKPPPIPNKPVQYQHFNPPPAAPATVARPPTTAPVVKQEPQQYPPPPSYVYPSRSSPEVVEGKRPPPGQLYVRHISNVSPSVMNVSPSVAFDRKRSPVCMYSNDPGFDLDDLRSSQFEFDANESAPEKKRKL
ncbi:DNA repair and recombination protein Rad22 [Thraustotheca clavata]|uniref:DNA repair and recombination protein Rad22 n=1 Tax=Thraustotheca clavata TaxID=74557 RepID=A0A1V9YSM7_9STRA|nr:DNA repair and recombination protein Rad22 [Thraustotheca clavata]